MKFLLTSEIGYFKTAGIRSDREPMLVGVQDTGATGAEAGALLFGDAAKSFAIDAVHGAAVVVRIRTQQATTLAVRQEASISLTLAAAEQLRDALAQAIAAAKVTTGSSAKR